MAQWVQGLALSLLCRGYHLWPENFCVPWTWPKRMMLFLAASFTTVKRQKHPQSPSTGKELNNM